MIRDKLAYLRFHLGNAMKSCNDVVISPKSSAKEKEIAAFIGKCSREVYNNDLRNHTDLELDLIIENLRNLMRPIKSISKRIAS